MTDERIPPAISEALDSIRKPHKMQPAVTPSGDRTILRRWAWVGGFAVLLLAVGVGERLTRSPGSVAQRKSRTVVTLSQPAEVPDSNGLFHGLGDHVQNSFSDDRQSLARQKSEVVDEFSQKARMQGIVGGNAQASGPMIISVAGLTLTTKDFDTSRTRLEEILMGHRGYVAEMNVSTPTGAPRSLTATLRVPADQLEAALADLRKLGRVESESQSGQEVTAQYIDLEARLSNARKAEQRLTDLLRQRTGKLADVLAVENEIDRVRGEIERMEAERKTLAGQVAFATINLNAAEDYRAQLQVVPVSTFARIRNAAVEGYRRMVETVVGLALFIVSYGPSLLLWGAILFFPARAGWKQASKLLAR